MSLIDSARPKPMIWRLLLVCSALVAALLAAGIWSGAQALNSNADSQMLQLVGARSQSVAAQIRARLAAAGLTVQAVTSVDAGAGASVLQQRVLRADAIGGVILGSVLPRAPRWPIALNSADRNALDAGQTLLRSAPRGATAGLYLIHNTTAAGAPMIAFFELTNEWLWQDMADIPGSHSEMIVIDGAGNVLRASGPVDKNLLPVLVQEHDGAASDVNLRGQRSWQVGGQEWRGALTRVIPTALHLNSDAWTVVSFTPWHAGSYGLKRMSADLAYLIALGLILALAAAWYLRDCWEPVLLALRRSLRDLGDGRYENVPLGRASDTPRRVAIEFNRAVALMGERVRALESLNEIDRLLLEAGDLEHSLDAVLARVRRITGCQAAALALLDQDAPTQARVYVAAGGTMERAVTRISIDSELVENLASHTSGFTVLRSEPGRHSFLEPLLQLGAQFFWLWPVKLQGTDQVVAILAVGYHSAPEVPPELASYGTECAARLGVALSNRARDELLYRQAHFDALTSLPNRLLFRDRLAQELASASVGVLRGALLYVDLDHFKRVNDSVGHTAGDQVLTVVAQRLRACVKDGDTVARLGGDEFTVILRGVGAPEGAQRVDARIIQSLELPVSVAGRDHQVCASIGITLFPDDGGTIEELMRNADLAMYQAKAGGRSRAAFYDRKMERMPSAAADSGLFKALRKREFSLYYQPQFDVRSGSLVGLEALLRWQPPREPMRYPADFVPAAEQSGLIVDIGAWVLETACNQLAIWREQGIAPERLALNVSVYQLRQPEFPTLVRRALDRVGVPPEMLEIELTESAFADDDARTSLRRLAALGVRLSLDDFGTGYSSLGYLRQHPVQAIKIDRSFIEEIPHSVTASTLAETIIKMAHALGKRVVAEGVETSDQLDFLRERQCDLAQGFFLAHPRSAADTTALLTARLSVPPASDQAVG
jgi:diguanylate cyclase (GGDEF)-like protein